MMPTKPRASKEPLPPITTTSLWTGEQEAAIPTPELLAVVNETSSTALANLLWEEPVSVVSSSGDSGLFDITAVRADYRRTSKLPAAVNMIRKPRKTGEALPTLKSKNLWKKQPKLGHASTLKTASLWNKPTVKPSLFQSDPNRKVYRTTSAEPAALQMSEKFASSKSLYRGSSLLVFGQAATLPQLSSIGSQSLPCDPGARLSLQSLQRARDRRHLSLIHRQLRQAPPRRRLPRVPAASSRAGSEGRERDRKLLKLRRILYKRQRLTSPLSPSYPRNSS